MDLLDLVCGMTLLKALLGHNAGRKIASLDRRRIVQPDLILRIVNRFDHHEIMPVNLGKRH